MRSGLNLCKLYSRGVIHSACADAENMASQCENVSCRMAYFLKNPSMSLIILARRFTSVMLSNGNPSTNVRY